MAPYNKPFGFVPLEAMACGRPVLGVREGGIPETVVEGKTGFLAERDPEHFAYRLIELLREPEKTAGVSRLAAEIVQERWSWEASIHELARLPETLRKRGDIMKRRRIAPAAMRRWFGAEHEPKQP
ncbi:MAG: glycosyltransferase [Longimicrobiaceae bacterium]